MKVQPTKAPAASHSVRVPDARWEAARRRCDREGTTMNAMLNELIDGYGRGMLNLPKITKQYVTSGPPAATTTSR